MRRCVCLRYELRACDSAAVSITDFWRRPNRGLLARGTAGVRLRVQWSSRWLAVGALLAAGGFELGLLFVPSYPFTGPEIWIWQWPKIGEKFVGHVRLNTRYGLLRQCKSGRVVQSRGLNNFMMALYTVERDQDFPFSLCGSFFRIC